MNYRDQADKWNRMNLTERGNWLAENGFSYTFAVYNIVSLPKSVLAELAKLNLNAILRRV